MKLKWRQEIDMTSWNWNDVIWNWNDVMKLKRRHMKLKWRHEIETTSYKIEMTSYEIDMTSYEIDMTNLITSFQIKGIQFLLPYLPNCWRRQKKIWNKPSLCLLERMQCKREILSVPLFLPAVWRWGERENVNLAWVRPTRRVEVGEGKRMLI